MAKQLMKMTKTKMGTQVQNCRMCHGKSLHKFLDLDFSPPSDGFLSEEQLDNPEIFYPLQVYLCTNCGLAQLGYVVAPEILYRKNYPYESSMTETGKKHFFEMATTITKKMKLKQNSLTVDIGSNVGVLLSGFKAHGMKVVGVDPATNIAKIANSNGIYTIPEFFSPKIAKYIVKKYGKADVITGTNVFAHLNDLHTFMEGIKILLKEKGALVIEAPYFVDLVKNLEYDTIYHEHLSYISVKPLAKFFKKFNMTIFDVERHKIHGGSIRFFVGSKKSFKFSSTAKKLIELEEKEGIYFEKKLKDFADTVASHREKLVSLIYELKRNGKKIAGISAPAKGNTLLNYCKIDGQALDFITEKSKIKIGLYTPGMHIKIYPDNVLIERKIDYALVLAWNFAEEIINNMGEFRKNGGKFIIPIPEPKIV